MVKPYLSVSMDYNAPLLYWGILLPLAKALARASLEDCVQGGFHKISETDGGMGIFRWNRNVEFSWWE